MIKVVGQPISKQLDRINPDKPSTASFALAEIFQDKLTKGHTLSEEESDVDVLYRLRVQYLADNPQDISLTELTKASQTKDKGEMAVGDQYCQFMASFDNAASIVINAEVVDKQ